MMLLRLEMFLKPTHSLLLGLNTLFAFVLGGIGANAEAMRGARILYHFRVDVIQFLQSLTNHLELLSIDCVVFLGVRNSKRQCDLLQFGWDLQIAWVCSEPSIDKILAAGALFPVSKIDS